MARPLSRWTGGRWIAACGLLVAAAFFVQRLAATGDSLLEAFLLSCGAALAFMVVAGTVHRFWGGSKLTNASGPGGWGIGFGAQGFGATRKAVAELNSRVDDQMKTLNERLYDLEKVVFKERPADAG